MKKETKTNKALYEKKMKTLANLERNWDQRGAGPINPEIIENIKNLIDFEGGYLKYRSNFFINPTGRGSVILEFKKNNNTMFLELGEDFHSISYVSEFSFIDNLSFSKLDIEKAKVAIIEFFTE